MIIKLFSICCLTICPFTSLSTHAFNEVEEISLEDLKKQCLKRPLRDGEVLTATDWKHSSRSCFEAQELDPTFAIQPSTLKIFQDMLGKEDKYKRDCFEYCQNRILLSLQRLGSRAAPFTKTLQKMIVEEFNVIAIETLISIGPQAYDAAIETLISKSDHLMYNTKALNTLAQTGDLGRSSHKLYNELYPSIQNYLLGKKSQFQYKNEIGDYIANMLLNIGGMPKEHLINYVNWYAVINSEIPNENVINIFKKQDLNHLVVTLSSFITNTNANDRILKLVESLNSKSTSLTDALIGRVLENDKIFEVLVRLSANRILLVDYLVIKKWIYNNTIHSSYNSLDPIAEIEKIDNLLNLLTPDSTPFLQSTEKKYAALAVKRLNHKSILYFKNDFHLETTFELALTQLDLKQLYPMLEHILPYTDYTVSLLERLTSPLTDQEFQMLIKSISYEVSAKNKRVNPRKDKYEYLDKRGSGYKFDYQDMKEMSEALQYIFKNIDGSTSQNRQVLVNSLRIANYIAKQPMLSIEEYTFGNNERLVCRSIIDNIDSFAQIAGHAIAVIKNMDLCRVNEHLRLKTIAFGFLDTKPNSNPSIVNEVKKMLASESFANKDSPNFKHYYYHLSDRSTWSYKRKKAEIIYELIEGSPSRTQSRYARNYPKYQIYVYE